MRTKKLLLASVIALSAPAFAQTCQCIDVGDIKQRMKEAQTAIAAYNEQIMKMSEQMQRTQEPLAYTPERRKKLQGHVQDALNGVTGGRIAAFPTGGDNPGSTDNLCNTTINGHPSATACIREAVKRHEEHHRQECLKTRTAGKVWDAVKSGKDRFERDGILLPQYAVEEIGGYTAEVMYLQSELTRLAKPCEPKPKQPEVRDYTAERRNRAPQGQKPADPVQNSVDSVRKRLGF
jgi:hypothetical protein